MSLIPSVKEMRYSINESVYSCNPGALLENFMCIYCNNIVVGPIFLKCEHSSCRSCFISENFKNPIKETMCTKCDTCLESPGDMSTSSLLQSVLTIQKFNVIMVSYCKVSWILRVSHFFSLLPGRSILKGCVKFSTKLKGSEKKFLLLPENK